MQKTGVRDGSDGQRRRVVESGRHTGWFLDNKQYRRTDCVDTVSCAPTEAIKRGIRYWGGVVPERWQNGEPSTQGEGVEPASFGCYKVYFNQTDCESSNDNGTVQPLGTGSVSGGGPCLVTRSHCLSFAVTDRAMFAPACLSHEVITRGCTADMVFLSVVTVSETVLSY
ncbi:hypothetical protein NFI96_008232 [Prochilodus magdalenae]|nr:hypothetical protein NFI96_008232 [Prochilodus magdalenae]